MISLRRLLRGVDAISDWAGRIVGYIIYAGIGILVWEVTMRYIFNAPTIWAYGVSQRFFVPFYLVAGLYVLRHRAHITLDIVYVRFSLRTKAILDVITASLFFSFFGALLWYGSHFALASVRILENSQAPFHAPLWPVKLTVPVVVFFLLLQGAAKFIRDFITGITGRQCER